MRWTFFRVLGPRFTHIKFVKQSLEAMWQLFLLFFTEFRNVTVKGDSGKKLWRGIVKSNKGFFPSFSFFMRCAVLTLAFSSLLVEGKCKKFKNKLQRTLIQQGDRFLTHAISCHSTDLKIISVGDGTKISRLLNLVPSDQNFVDFLLPLYVFWRKRLPRRKSHWNENV